MKQAVENFRASTTIPTDHRIDYNTWQNGIEEHVLKRDEEFIVARRGSRVPSCARSKVKCACVLLHKAVCYVRAAHEAWKFCVTVFSSSTNFIFSTVSYYRQFCWSSRKQQSAFVNRMQYRSRVVESITLVWKKNGACCVLQNKYSRFVRLRFAHHLFCLLYLLGPCFAFRSS